MTPSIFYLILALDCSQPRVNFSAFFQAQRGYDLSEPPAPIRNDMYINDAGRTIGEYADYAERYRDKCERKN